MSLLERYSFTNWSSDAESTNLCCGERYCRILHQAVWPGCQAEGKIMLDVLSQISCQPVSLVLSIRNNMLQTGEDILGKSESKL